MVQFKVPQWLLHLQVAWGQCNKQIVKPEQNFQVMCVGNIRVPMISIKETWWRLTSDGSNLYSNADITSYRDT